MPDLVRTTVGDSWKTRSNPWLRRPRIYTRHCVGRCPQTRVGTVSSTRGPGSSHHGIGGNLKRVGEVVNGYVWMEMATGYAPVAYWVEEVTEVT
jgi:hypothetical protein